MSRKLISTVLQSLCTCEINKCVSMNLYDRLRVKSLEYEINLKDKEATIKSLIQTIKNLESDKKNSDVAAEINQINYEMLKAKTDREIAELSSRVLSAKRRYEELQEPKSVDSDSFPAWLIYPI